MKPWMKDSSRSDFNEYYTLYEECEKIFRPIIDRLNNIRIHCPCDDENSNIVKWLKNNTNSLITYSTIDMNSDEARDLMLESDMVVTNPPFTMKEWKPFYFWLNDVYKDVYNKEYFIWGPIPSSGPPLIILKYIKYIYTLSDSRVTNRPYIKSSGRMTKAPTYWYCSWKVPHLNIEYKECEDVEFYEGIPVYNYSKHVPNDYYDWMYVPISYVRFIYLEDFEIDYEAGFIPNHYIRIKLRRKLKETNS